MFISILYQGLIKCLVLQEIFYDFYYIFDLDWLNTAKRNTNKEVVYFLYSATTFKSFMYLYLTKFPDFISFK